MKHIIHAGLIIWLLDLQATAAPIIDQQYVAPNIGYILDYPGDYLAQTFTAAHTGLLTSVGVQIQVFNLGASAPLTDDLYLNLVPTNSAGAPLISQVLATHTISRHTVPLGYNTTGSMIDVNLSGAGVYVAAGDKLAITIATNHVFFNQPDNAYQYVWFFGLQDPHPGGGFYMYSPMQWGPEPYLIADFLPPPNTRDFGFRVFIDPIPEPATAPLVIFGLFLFRTCSRQRPKP